MLLLMLLMAWLSIDIYQGFTVRDIPISVIDFDNSSLSRTLVRFLDATSELVVSEHRPVSVEDARNLLVLDEIAAVVVIPSSFSINIKKGKRGEVLVATDMSNILIGRNASAAISGVATTFSAGVRLTTVEKLGAPDEQSMAKVLPIALETNFNFNPYRNYAIYLVPAVVFFLFHIYLLIGALAVQRDYPKATERAGAFLGLFIWCLLLASALMWGMLQRSHIFVQSDVGPTLALLAVFIATDILFVIGVRRLFRIPLTTMQVTIFLGMLSLMFSGITWPTDMFPKPFQWFSMILPFTPFARGFRMLLHYPMNFGDMTDIFGFFGGQILFYAGLILVATLFYALIGSLRKRTSCK